MVAEHLGWLMVMVNSFNCNAPRGERCHCAKNILQGESSYAEGSHAGIQKLINA